MVKQGDIIIIKFDPTIGHEQGKKRPALVISSDKYNNICGGLAIVLPITSQVKQFPYHIDLPESLKTKGQVLCQHPKTFDIKSRGYKVVESVPSEYIQRIISIVKTCID